MYLLFALNDSHCYDRHERFTVALRHGDLYCPRLCHVCTITPRGRCRRPIHGKLYHRRAEWVCGNCIVQRQHLPDPSCGPIFPSTINGSGTGMVSCIGYASGGYTLAVTGTSGTITHSVSIQVAVQPGSVGGAAIPVDKLELFMQFIPTLSLSLVVLSIGVVGGWKW